MYSEQHSKLNSARVDLWSISSTMDLGLQLSEYDFGGLLPGEQICLRTELNRLLAVEVRNGNELYLLDPVAGSALKLSAAEAAAGVKRRDPFAAGGIQARSIQQISMHRSPVIVLP